MSHVRRVFAATGVGVWALVGWRYAADACRYAVAKRSYQTKENA